MLGQLAPEEGQMKRALSWLLASVVLGVVLYGLFDAHCCEAVFERTIDGLLVGVVRGLVRMYTQWELMPVGKTVSVEEAKREFTHHVREDMVIGLLIGVATAIVIMTCG
jgi:hypothetical protein